MNRKYHPGRFGPTDAQRHKIEFARLRAASSTRSRYGWQRREVRA